MERWKAVKGYEGFYEVSDLGQVRSVPRLRAKGDVLKQCTNPHNGYCYVSLCAHNLRKSVRVHRLVMEAFNPTDKKPGYDKEHTINHIDGDKTNNRLDNLEWCSQSENQRHAYEKGLQGPNGIKVICLDTGKIYDSMCEAARDIGGEKGGMIARVCDGRRSHYRNKHFAYYKDYINGTIPEYKGKFKKGGTASLWR